MHWAAGSYDDKSIKIQSTKDRIEICARQSVTLEVVGHNIMPEKLELKREHGFNHSLYCAKMQERDWRAWGAATLLAKQIAGPPIDCLTIRFPLGCTISGTTTFLKGGKFEFLVDERCEANYLGPGVLP